MAQNHQEYKHGTMDVKEHEKTFDGFIRFWSWASVLAIVVLVFMALANA